MSPDDHDTCPASVGRIRPSHGEKFFELRGLLEPRPPRPGINPHVVRSRDLTRLRSIGSIQNVHRTCLSKAVAATWFARALRIEPHLLNPIYHATYRWHAPTADCPLRPPPGSGRSVSGHAPSCRVRKVISSWRSLRSGWPVEGLSGRTSRIRVGGRIGGFWFHAWGR